MAIASPRMVEMVTGEKIDLQDLGGPDVHSNTPAARTSSPTTRNTRANSSRSLSAISPTTPTRNRHSQRRPEILPQDRLDRSTGGNKGYDMFDVIDRVVDAGSTLELRPEYGKEIITSFARIDGRPVGIVANQPNHRAGAIFPDAAEGRRVHLDL